MNSSQVIIIVSFISVVITPIVTLITIWIKSRNENLKRIDTKEEKYIENIHKDLKDLREQKDRLEKKLEAQGEEIRVIKIELKNRDEEYVALYKEHTTLKAQYENLVADHDQLKKQYDATVIELTRLKEDILIKAEQVATAIIKN